MSAGCDGAAGAGCVGLSADIRSHLPGLPGPPLPGPAAAGHQTLHRLAALDQKGALFLFFFIKLWNLVMMNSVVEPAGAGIFGWSRSR